MTSAIKSETAASQNTPTSRCSAAPTDTALRDPQRAAEGLPALPEALAELNRIYLQEVTRRTLLTAVEAAGWLDQRVTVFLRHDKVRVFAIVRNGSVAMADFVTLTDAAFHVNEIGRQQSNQMLGPLPNHRTVHAYLTGRLIEISDSGRLPDPQVWESVVYNPTLMHCFQRAESSQPVFCSSEVKLVPGSHKVWCLRNSDPLLCVQSSRWPS